MKAIQFYANPNKHGGREILTNNDKIVSTGKDVKEKGGMEAFQEVVDGSHTRFNRSEMTLSDVTQSMFLRCSLTFQEHGTRMGLALVPHIE